MFVTSLNLQLANQLIIGVTLLLTDRLSVLVELSPFISVSFDVASGAVLTTVLALIALVIIRLSIY